MAVQFVYPVQELTFRLLEYWMLQLELFSKSFVAALTNFCKQVCEKDRAMRDKLHLSQLVLLENMG